MASDYFGRLERRKAKAAEFDEARKAKAELEVAIERMAGNGMTIEEIGLLTGIKGARLYRKYYGLVAKGQAKARNDVADMGFMIATGGPDRDWRKADAGMIKFWLERMGGPQWAPPRKDEDEGPDLTRLTVQQLMELEKALRPLAKASLIDVVPTSREVKDGDGGGVRDSQGTDVFGGDSGRSGVGAGDQ